MFSLISTTKLDMCTHQAPKLDPTEIQSEELEVREQTSMVVVAAVRRHTTSKRASAKALQMEGTILELYPTSDSLDQTEKWH
jgi:molecular chaperone GrpE (heat shock protein)